MRGIFAERNSTNLPWPLFFKEGNRSIGACPTEIVEMNNLIWEKRKGFETKSENQCGALRFEIILDSGAIIPFFFSGHCVKSMRVVAVEFEFDFLNGAWIQSIYW
jgi:hypothetical protein